jgi:hypothetical protein
VIALAGLAVLGGPFSMPVLAQESENKEAPEILTTDLTRRQKVDTSQLEASFVIYDEDVISEVTINGEKQPFVKANTLTINKRLSFQRGLNKVVVVATDEKGNTRTKNYLVAYGVDLAPEADASTKDSGAITWKILGNIQYNNDTNPNNDLGLPIDTGDISIEGQIADDEQADVQTAVNLLGLITFGKITGMAGYSQSSYSKALYESLNSKVILAGVSFGPKPGERGIAARYMLLDINLDNEAFAQYHIINAGYQLGRQDKEDGTTRHLLGIIYNYKLFADSSLDAGSTLLFNWEYSNLDADKLDYFKSVLAYGSGNDGNEATEFSTLTMDFDWSNKWQSGFLQGTGFGMHYKEYPNQEPLIADLGDSRIDIPIRFSFNLGWAFNPDWSLKFKYDYKVNVSTKNPSYKTITGLQLTGGF